MQQVAYCINDGHRSYGKKVAIIGYNQSSAAIAKILRERYLLKSLTILTNGEKPEWSEEQFKMLDEYGIKFIRAPIKK